MWRTPLTQDVAERIRSSHQEIYEAQKRPTPEQVADVAERTAKRVIKLLEAAGKSFDSELSGDDVDDFAKRQPALATLYAAADRGVDLSGERAGQATMRLIQQDSVEKKEPHAVVGGINIHAAVAFDARDRPRMERMCRYLARPPIAQHRLTRRSDGLIQYTMKKVWRDGTHAIVLGPLDLIGRGSAPCWFPWNRSLLRGST